MKIYTKTGDSGQTSLIGGSRVPKNHLRIEAYGTVDELNSTVGVLRDSLEFPEVIDELIAVQERLFTVGSTLAADPEKSSKIKLPALVQADIEMLEKSIDKMDSELPPMRNFVLPGGHTAVSNAHVARTVCRRAERKVIALQQSAKIPELIQPYLNRLSDYFFVLARFLSLKLNVKETPWKPDK